MSAQLFEPIFNEERDVLNTKGQQQYRGPVEQLRALVVCKRSSSALVKPVARLPLKMLSPSASVTRTSAAGPWHTAVVGLPAR